MQTGDQQSPESPQSENTAAEKAQEAARVQQSLKRSVRILLSTVLDFLRNILNIKDGSDEDSTREEIKKNIDFKGPNVYILIFSIFIASIGLNLSSTAVVIGAMLISPLMGPIIGAGLALGTTDLKLLKRSMKSLGVAVGVSILTSAIYFAISPISEPSAEIVSRTAPTLLDAFVAIFGGFAGIIAGSRKEKSNVVPGVAIATALMPPLCTAGYGLANGNWAFFFGAFYLFMLNSIFIALSTFVVVKYLGFSTVDFINPDRERRIKRVMISLIVIILIPSGIIFWNLIQHSFFDARALRFVNQNVDFAGTSIVNTKFTYNDNDAPHKIEVFAIGEPLNKETIEKLNRKLPYEGLDNTEIIIHQANDKTDQIAGQLTAQVKSGIIEDMYKKNEALLESKDEKIRELQTQLATFTEKDTIPLNSLYREVRVTYEDLTSFGYAESYQITLGKRDTIPTFIIEWGGEIPPRQKSDQTDNLRKYLAVRLNVDSVRVISN